MYRQINLNDSKTREGGKLEGRQTLCATDLKEIPQELWRRPRKKAHTKNKNVSSKPSSPTRNGFPNSPKFLTSQRPAQTKSQMSNSNGELFSWEDPQIYSSTLPFVPNRPSSLPQDKSSTILTPIKAIWSPTVPTTDSTKKKLTSKPLVNPNRPLSEPIRGWQRRKGGGGISFEDVPFTSFKEIWNSTRLNRRTNRLVCFQ